MSETDLDPSFIDHLFHYDDGIIFWKNHPTKRSMNGKKAGYLVGVGRRQGIDVRIKGRWYKVSRVIWCLFNKKWPDNLIDHKDGDRFNNKIDNLREATYSQNSLNCGKYVSNTSGYRGVSFHRKTGKWWARVTVNGTRKSLGLFATAKEASESYELHSTDIYGEFKRKSEEIEIVHS